MNIEKQIKRNKKQVARLNKRQRAYDRKIREAVLMDRLGLACSPVLKVSIMGEYIQQLCIERQNELSEAYNAKHGN